MKRVQELIGADQSSRCRLEVWLPRPQFDACPEPGLKVVCPALWLFGIKDLLATEIAVAYDVSARLFGHFAD